MHRVFSGRLLLLTYRGRRSGRTFAIPLRYAETDDGLVVLAARPARKLWWRSFRGGATGTVTLRGTCLDVEGILATGTARAGALDAYVTAYPRSARLVRDAEVVVLVPRR